MKIDLKKAYDTTSWDFVESILLGYGFPHEMVQKLVVCLTTPIFFVKLNDRVHEFLVAKKA